MNTSIDLGLKKSLTALLVNVEKNNLAITTTNCDFVMTDSLDGSHTKSTDILSVNEVPAFDLEAAELSGAGTGEQEFFSRLGESHASVFTDHTTSINWFLFHLTVSRVKLP